MAKILLSVENRKKSEKSQINKDKQNRNQAKFVADFIFFNQTNNPSVNIRIEAKSGGME